jgi:hypothetical protein
MRPVLAVAPADGCPDMSVNLGAELRRMPRHRVRGYGAGLRMAQNHDEDGRQRPDEADGARDQPYDHFEIHHDLPRPRLPAIGSVRSQAVGN